MPEFDPDARRWQLSGEQWERAVAKQLDQCAGCNRPLKAGEEYVATVAATPEGFVRQDRCAACALVQKDNIFSFWRARRPAERSGVLPRLDFDSLQELLRRLDGRDDASSCRLRWIVTILLLRRRYVQIVNRSTVDGVEVLEVKPRHDDRTFLVRDPKLSPEDFESLHEDLSRIFNLEPKPSA
jgi:hypothetical protein